MKLIIIDTSVIIFQIVGQIEKTWWATTSDRLLKICYLLVCAENAASHGAHLFQRFTAKLSAVVSEITTETQSWDVAGWAAKSQLYAESALNYVNSLGWLPTVAEHECKVIWVEDRKPYWRSSFHPEYKGNREDKPGLFACVYEMFLSLPNFARLAFPGFEADDIAAAIVRLWADSDKRVIDQVFLATVDSDWLGLIVDHNVFWCDTASHLPRLRQKQEAYVWLRGKWNKQAKKWKAVWELPHEVTFKPQDIWEWKLHVGDKIDNLAPGCPRYMIDLLSPPKIHDLAHAQTAPIYQAIKGATVIKGEDSQDYQMAIFSLGANLPIEPVFVPRNLL